MRGLSGFSTTALAVGLVSLLAPRPVAGESSSAAPAVSQLDLGEPAGGSGGAPGDPRRIERGSIPLDLTVGAGLVLTSPSDVNRVALADDTLAKVTVLSKREIMIDGLAPGRTTLFLWLAQGRRLRYVVVVRRDLSLVERVVQELDERIEVEASPDGDSIVLRGDVDSRATAEAALARAQEALHMLSPDAAKVRVLNLLNFDPDPNATADARLGQALATIDPRIRIRRIQVGEETEATRDAYVLEGRVKSVSAIMRAITVAERQLGGNGNKIIASDDRRRIRDRSGFFAGSGSSIGGGSTNVLSGVDPPPPGLASQLARGLVLTSESGRVVSFLEVDDLQQVQVAIRVLEIDRSRARSLGIDYRVDARHFSIGGLNTPDGSVLPGLRGQPASVNGASAGNLLGAYVDQHIAVFAAIDALEHVQVARAVAEPTILTLSGEEATVLVGGEVPIPLTTVGQITTLQSFAFREFGVRLDIRPTVDADDIIALEVSPSIVRPEPGLTVGQVPGFQIQSVQTTARVQAGQSLVLGGLLSFEETNEHRKVPILGDIPIINAAFRWDRKSRRERELLFVITPRLVGTSGSEAALELPARENPGFFHDPPPDAYTLEERRTYDPKTYGVERDRRRKKGAEAAPTAP